MARTLLDKNLTYKDGTGTDIKIRMTDVVDVESDLKCLTNQLSMDMLKSLSEGMKPTDDFFSYFRCKSCFNFYGSYRFTGKYFHKDNYKQIYYIKGGRIFLKRDSTNNE